MKQSKSITQLVELLGISDHDYFAVVDVSVSPPETKRIQASRLLEAVISSRWYAEAHIPSEEDGDLHDLWLHTPTSNYYEKHEDGWKLVGTLRGLPGPSGERGRDGRDGSQWYANPRDPLGTEGEAGSFWLNFRTGDLYQKGESGWGLPLLNVNERGAWEGPADRVSYTNEAYTYVETVQDALDELLYFPPTATFTNNIGTVETGRTIDAVTLNWSFNKDMKSGSIDGVSIPIDVRSGSRQLTDMGITSNHTFRLTASDGKETVSRTTSITFRYRRFWGTSEKAALPPEEIGDLNSELAANRTKTVTINGGGKYIYFAWPVAFGEPTFIINGLPNTAWTRSVVVFTNSHGHSAQYVVFRTNTLQFGSALNIQVE